MSQIYLIFGEDEYRVSNKAREIVNSILPESERTFGLETIDCAADTIDAALQALGKSFEALQTVGFFAETKVTWMRDASFLADNVVSRNDTVKEAVEKLGLMIKDGVPEGQTVVISAPKVHKNRKFFKACKDIAEVHEFAVASQGWQNEKNVAEFLRSEVARIGMKMNRDAGTAFLEKVGINSRNIVNELEKLSIYLGDRKEATIADVEAITSSSKTSVAWDLSDAVGTRDLKKALSVTRQLLFQRESGIMMIMILNSRIKDLMIYRQAIDNGWLEIGRQAQWNAVPPKIEELLCDMEKDPRKTHPFRAGLLGKQAQKFTMPQLKKCQHVLMATHRKLVSSSMPENVALELMLVQMLA